MKLRLTLLLTSGCTALALSAWAADPQDHDAHHPPEAAASAPARAAAAPASAPAGMPGDMMGRMDQHMKQMQALHEKMAKARTAAQRQALTAEHMKAMQEGMAMMEMMRGGAMGMGGVGAAGQPPMGQALPGDMAGRQQMLEKRMDMMQSMMQMMMDRLPPPAAK